MAKAEAPKQYYFVSARDINVGSLTGRSIAFEKGVPAHVPREMHREVMEKGILPCDKDGKIVDSVEAVEDINPAVKILLAPEDPSEREEKVTAVIKALVERNAREDFTAGGVPHEKAVTAALGWKVDQKEIRALWTVLKPELMQGK